MRFLRWESTPRLKLGKLSLIEKMLKVAAFLAFSTFFNWIPIGAPKRSTGQS
jgi:hypothetical protein